MPYNMQCQRHTPNIHHTPMHFNAVHVVDPNQNLQTADRRQAGMLRGSSISSLSTTRARASLSHRSSTYSTPTIPPHHSQKHRRLISMGLQTVGDDPMRTKINGGAGSQPWWTSFTSVSDESGYHCLQRITSCCSCLTTPSWQQPGSPATAQSEAGGSSGTESTGGPPQSHSYSPCRGSSGPPAAPRRASSSPQTHPPGTRTYTRPPCSEIYRPEVCSPVGGYVSHGTAAANTAAASEAPFQTTAWVRSISDHCICPQGQPLHPCACFTSAYLRSSWRYFHACMLSLFEHQVHDPRARRMSFACGSLCLFTGVRQQCVNETHTQTSAC